MFLPITNGQRSVMSEQLPSTATTGTGQDMTDLSDYEIARLTAELKEQQAQSRPLLGTIEPISVLRQEYEGSAGAFSAKIDTLDKDGWSGVRRTRRDGDCWYRSFAFAYLERLVNAPASAALLALAKLESLLPLLDQAGFMQDIYDDFYDPLRTLLRDLGGQPTQYQGATRPTSSSLHTSFNDPEISNSIVVFLRLLTSAFLQAHADEYTPFLFAVDGNDVAQIMDPETGMPDMKRFCGWCVEAVNKEADHLQIVAITRALGVHTRVAYLDPSHSINATAGGGGVDTEGTACDWVLFQEDAEESLDAALLYRPGHYDLLYR